MMYQRIFCSESYLETLGILSLLTQALLHTRKFDDASEVTGKALVGYKFALWHETSPDSGESLRTAMAV
jgi:hypothetical protein